MVNELIDSMPPDQRQLVWRCIARIQQRMASIYEEILDGDCNSSIHLPTVSTNVQELINHMPEVKRYVEQLLEQMHMLRKEYFKLQYYYRWKKRVIKQMMRNELN